MRRKFHFIGFKCFLFRVSTYLVLFIASSEETILRLPCKIDALFTIFHDSKRLVGDVLMSFSALEDTQCMVKCIENAKCRSYNTNKEDGRCEINGKALVDNGTKLVTDTNWVYKSTNYSSTLVCSINEITDGLPLLTLSLSSDG